MEVEVSQKAPLSGSHIEAAAYFARQSGDIEAESGKTDVDGPHRAYVIGAVVLSCAFLETTVNELFCDIEDNVDRFKGIDGSARDLMSRMWQSGVPRTASFDLISKYNIALALNSIEPLRTSENPAQDAVLLTRLRNELVHFEPQWLRTVPAPTQAELPRIEQALRGKFKLNAMLSDGYLWWPHRCLGHGCAAWSVRTAIALADEFSSLIQFVAPYHSIRDRLDPDPRQYLVD